MVNNKGIVVTNNNLMGLVAFALLTVANADSLEPCRKIYDKHSISYMGEGEYMDRLGVAYYKGNGVLRDYATAIRYHYQACKLGSAQGCNHAGYMYDQGEAVRQSHSIARKYFMLSCNYGSYLGCYNLAIIYEYGQGMKRSDTKAVKYYQKSCNLGFEDACRSARIIKLYMVNTD